ncbi:4-(cytidine 5'-diphospho)-2-C-methyl-D-erythritol kinase [Chlamydia ibidis]|uniref:4-diphosphocytidyl-2-C-methyl-D-erythritol kinase n=2 Tax=Chlamydia ibidis TaxID=1405396 RepID=S7J3Q7_9CHLA|nr:4-(cytidine 5'-diphospho)-2-C-methyl-D-erythritol kinase [Chlamydia ibidis]EPP34652.1 4-(cytidine 5'-diphospho)-2-C-methyl-D-erythritol kinase [Chlamydia ibidis]EQM62464.1 4-(cytidine 5'-diphospho)-2-C-methyl-D-erythritol kinase [Chlamydia ibidis 10-1398/6]
MEFFSPAKLNLFLKVFGKKSNGFHEIITRYQTINFGDTLSLSLGDIDRLMSNLPALENSDNLIWKSLKLFRQVTGITTPVVWQLYKRIPLGAGLGGGSSNAATALFALNSLFKTNLSVDVLQDLGKSIGMDVPLFFSSGSSIGIGQGDHILPNSVQLEEENYVLYFSKEGVNTKLAFSQLLPSDYAGNVKDAMFYSGDNDLEKSVFRFRPDLKAKKEELERIWSPFHSYVMMSGTGATLFVRYPKKLEEDLITRKTISKIIQKTQGILANAIHRTNPCWYIGHSKSATCK